MSFVTHFSYPVLPHPHISEKFASLGTENPDKTYRLGLFGGTFDPVHNAHIALAKAAIEELELEGVLFIPASTQPFKSGEIHASTENRYRMLRKVTEAEPLFDVSCIEIDRGGVSYSIDTLLELKQYFPENVEFYFIIGTDILTGLVHWYRPRDIARLVTLAIAKRPGYAEDIDAVMGNDGLDFFD